MGRIGPEPDPDRRPRQPHLIGHEGLIAVDVLDPPLKHQLGGRPEIDEVAAHRRAIAIKQPRNALRRLDLLPGKPSQMDKAKSQKGNVKRMALAWH